MGEDSKPDKHGSKGQLHGEEEHEALRRRLKDMLPPDMLDEILKALTEEMTPTEDDLDEDSFHALKKNTWTMWSIDNVEEKDPSRWWAFFFFSILGVFVFVYAYVKDIRSYSTALYAIYLIMGFVFILVSYMCVKYNFMSYYG